MRPLNDILLSAVDVSTSQASSAFDCSFIIRASIQAVFTGSPNGLLSFQASNDAGIASGGLPNQFIPTNWSVIQNGNMFVNAAGVWLMPETEMSYQYLRVVFTPVPVSSGTMTVRIKSVGI